MLVALILVSVALAICLGILFLGQNSDAELEKLQARVDAENKQRHHAESELERKRKELEENKGQVNDIKDQLRQAKKKLHDQREGEKDGKELARARLDVERSASSHLEAVRSELSGALTEIERLRSESMGGARRREVPRPPPAPVSAEAPVVAAPVAPPLPVQIVKTIRELNPAEKERLDRAEHQSAKDRARAADVDKELKRHKGRAESQSRLYTVAKGELELSKDKFKALEKRLNRTLLERDLMKRAIVALEKKTGINAERTELTSEEVAASDREIDAQQKAEAAKATEAAEAAQRASEAATVTPPPEQPNGDAENPARPS